MQSASVHVVLLIVLVLVATIAVVPIVVVLSVDFVHEPVDLSVLAKYDWNEKTTHANSRTSMMTAKAPIRNLVRLDICPPM